MKTKPKHKTKTGTARPASKPQNQAMGIRKLLQHPRVFDVPGNLYEGQIPGTACFVPDSLVKRGKLNEGQYVSQGWATLNIKAQPLGAGSHLFPDLSKPYPPVVNWSECPSVEFRRGVWVFAGTQIPVAELFTRIEAGGTIENLCASFPALKPAAVGDVLFFLLVSLEQPRV